MPPWLMRERNRLYSRIFPRPAVCLVQFSQIQGPLITGASRFVRRSLGQWSRTRVRIGRIFGCPRHVGGQRYLSAFNDAANMNFLRRIKRGGSRFRRHQLNAQIGYRWNGQGSQSVAHFFRGGVIAQTGARFVPQFNPMKRPSSQTKCRPGARVPPAYRSVARYLPPERCKNPSWVSD